MLAKREKYDCLVTYWYQGVKLLKCMKGEVRNLCWPRKGRWWGSHLPHQWSCHDMVVARKNLLYVMSIQICPERIPHGKLFHYLPPHICNLGLNYIEDFMYVSLQTSSAFFRCFPDDSIHWCSILQEYESHINIIQWFQQVHEVYTGVGMNKR